MDQEKLNVSRAVSLIHALPQAHSSFLSLYQIHLSSHWFQSPRDPSLLADFDNMYGAS